jgi:transcriptional regulator with XRE-family HTH domain
MLLKTDRIVRCTIGTFMPEWSKKNGFFGQTGIGGNLMAIFGELLRRLRGTRPQRQVAEELNMPVTTLSTLERQESVPRGPVLKRFAEYYGVPVTYFYPVVVSEMRSNDSAKEWLRFVRQDSTAKEGIATYAPADYPEAIKRQFADKIRQKKNAETPRR